MSIGRLVRHMEAKGLDGFIVQRPENVRYLSGYTGEDSVLLVLREGCLFITDPRYTEQAAKECPDLELRNWRDEARSLAEALASYSKKAGLTSVAFEADYMTYEAHATLDKAFGSRVRLVPGTGVVEEYRKIKRPDEIEKLRLSCGIADRALARLLDDIKPGRSEKELAALLSLHLVEEGSDTKPYGGILISGPRTSLLHGIPSERPIAKGDLVLIDFGGQYQGYLADMTRTIVVGKASPEQQEVHAYERAMVEATLAAVKSGAASKDVFAASTRPIEGTKYFGRHYTGIGHGIGLFVHELPFLSPRSEDILAENMVITVEPGIYIPDWGGVRIEDQILVTKDGYVDFTSSTKDLIEV